MAIWRRVTHDLGNILFEWKNQVEMKGNQNAMKYTKILELHEQDEVLFQQDHAAIHAAKHTKAWFTS